MTAGKLATKSVKRRALSKRIRNQLANSGSGQQPAGPTAGRLHYFDAARVTPTTQTVLNFIGLTFSASRGLTGTTSTLNLSLKSDQDALLRVNFNVDNGTDPTIPGASTPGNIQVALPAGVETSLGGPGADPPNFARVIATGIYTSQGRAMTLTLSEFVDGVAGTCAVDGVLLAPS